MCTFKNLEEICRPEKINKKKQLQLGLSQGQEKSENQEKSGKTKKMTKVRKKLGFLKKVRKSQKI